MHTEGAASGQISVGKCVLSDGHHEYLPGGEHEALLQTELNTKKVLSAVRSPSPRSGGMLLVPSRPTNEWTTRPGVTLNQSHGVPEYPYWELEGHLHAGIPQFGQYGVGMTGAAIQAPDLEVPFALKDMLEA